MAGAAHAPSYVREKEVAPTSTGYTEFHPRWYRQRTSTYWWLGNRHYVKFILRELSSLAVAWAVALNLYLVLALTRGQGSYAHFIYRVSQPWMIAVNLVAFAFLLLHSVTWFNLAPKAMAVRVRGRRLPAAAIAGPQYLAWLLVSVLLLYLIVGRR